MLYSHQQVYKNIGTYYKGGRRNSQFQDDHIIYNKTIKIAQ